MFSALPSKQVRTRTDPAAVKFSFVIASGVASLLTAHFVPDEGSFIFQINVPCLSSLTSNISSRSQFSDFITHVVIVHILKNRISCLKKNQTGGRFSFYIQIRRITQNSCLLPLLPPRLKCFLSFLSEPLLPAFNQDKRRYLIDFLLLLDISYFPFGQTFFFVYRFRNKYWLFLQIQPAHLQDMHLSQTPYMYGQIGCHLL